jgi:hypothetical protein
MGFAHTEDDALLYSSTCTCTLVHTYMNRRTTLNM